MEIIEKHIKDKKTVEDITDLSAEFIKKEASLFSSADIQNERKKIEKFIRQNFKNLSVWEIRYIATNLFDKLVVDIERDTPEKIIFMIFTDILSGLKPSPSPLVFFYDGNPMVKKNGIIVEFGLLSEILRKIENLDDYKKYQIVLDIFSDEKLITEGVSVKLADLNFFLLNLLDRIIYEEIIPADMLLVQKNGRLTVENNVLNFGIVSVFASMYEYVTGEKQQFKGSFYTAEFSKLFVKIKHYVKNLFKNEEELEYLMWASQIEEKSIENRSVTVRDYQTQKNVFEESIRRQDANTFEKVESVFWLLGLKNINPVLLVRYYSGDDFIYYIFELFKQAQDRGFLTYSFADEMKRFLKKLFRYPYLSKGMLNQKTLDKPVKLLYSEDPYFSADYFYFTQQYDRFLDMVQLIKDKDEELSLKVILARYFTSDIGKDELVGWLSLSKIPEGEFLYHFLKGDTRSVPEKNPYRIVVDAVENISSEDSIINNIGEEVFYTQVLRILGFYPSDEKLIKIANLRFGI